VELSGDITGMLDVVNQMPESPSPLRIMSGSMPLVLRCLVTGMVYGGLPH
jgi:hypothetical protein